MMLDIADALPFILERSGRRTELLIPTILALLYTHRSLWRRRDRYRNRVCANRNGRNYGVRRGVDDRDGIGVLICHIGAGSVRRDGHPKRTSANRNGRNHGGGRGVDDRDVGVLVTGHVGAGSVRRDGYPNRT